MVQDRGWNRRNVMAGCRVPGALRLGKAEKKVLTLRYPLGICSQVQGVSTMARAKQVAKRNRRKIALPAWGAAGMSLAMAGGASAGVAPAADTSSKHNALPSVVTLGEEELSDVSLSTFFVFDREAMIPTSLGEKVAQRCSRCGGGRGCAARGCGGRCGGCRGCAVVRRCGVGVGCAVVGCARCSCSCCLSWGSCQLC